MDYDDFPDGVLIAGADGRVEYVNRRIKQMANAVGDEMIGMHLSQAMPFDDLNGHSWFESCDPYGGLDIRNRLSETSWWSPKGSEYMITASLIRSKPRGPVEKVIVSVRSARARNQADRERSDLVATVAHELRSPLTGIKGFSSTLLTKWDKFSDEQRQLMLETIDADADRLSRLITELLDAARIDAGRLTLKRGPVRVVDVVKHVLTNVSGGKATPFEPTIDGDIALIWGDSDRLHQVVTNLVENALRHGFGLRRVRVVMEPFPDRGDGVSIYVEDKGPGIPEDLRQRVFSRFWRSGPGAGSGLGMYIVRGIVQEHDGRIEIGDVADGGASIRVWLPINEPDTLTD